MAILGKLLTVMTERRLTAENVAMLSKGKITGMTVRRAVKGNNIQIASGKAIAKALKMEMDELL